MLNALAEFFTPEAGQARRQWLNDQEQRVGNALAYYLGPAADPIQSAAMLAGYMTPGADMMDASQASREMFAAETPLDAAAAGAAMLGATGMVLLPGNYNALSEGFSRTVDDMTAAYDPSRVNALIAYHGSPHTFDRFSMDKIGTGEGAQAYGHGLYFAENEAVARAYRDALRFPRIESPANMIERVADDLNYHRGNVEGVRGIYEGMLARGDEAAQEVARAKLAALPEAAQRFGGSMYQVQINADPSQLLDWDAPLSAQPGPVQALLGSNDMETAGGVLNRAYRNPMFGGDIARLPSADPAQVSEALRQAGIPGIQYLDAGSRAAGDGSRNFVIFDDSIINILKRYGIGAAVVGGGWALAPGEAEAATNAGILDPQNRDRETIQSWLATQ